MFNLKWNWNTGHLKTTNNKNIQTETVTLRATVMPSMSQEVPINT